MEEADTLVDRRRLRSIGDDEPHPPPDVGVAAQTPPLRLGIEQRGHAHRAILPRTLRENLYAVEALEARFAPDLVLVESGGDNLTATFSRALVDLQIFVIDVAGGDKVPRKGGPGITTSDLLVVNKVDLAPHVGADLDVMARDAVAARNGRLTVFVSLRRDPAAGPVVDVLLAALAAWRPGG